MGKDEELAIQLATKRLKTVMIGSISKIENSFGYLWGQHKNDNELLTEQELYFDNVWQDVRNNILNHGNKQMRVLEEELSRILRTKPAVKYKYRFPVIDEDQGEIE